MASEASSPKPDYPLVSLHLLSSLGQLPSSESSAGSLPRLLSSIQHSVQRSITSNQTNEAVVKTSSPAELDLEFHDLYVVDRIGSKLSYSSDKSFLADMNDLYRPPKYVPSRAVPLAFDEEKSRPDACWNCGDRNHKLGDCQHPIMDQDIIELNRAIFNVIHHAKSDSGVRFQSAHSSGKLRTEKRELEPRSGQYLHARRSAHSKRARYGASEGNLTTGLYHPSRAVGYYPYPHPPF